MFRIPVLLIIYLVYSHDGYTQILKTDRPVNPSDTTVGFSGSATFSFDFYNRTGSLDSENIYRALSFNNDLIYLSKKHEYIMINQINYKSATNATPLSTGYAHLRALLNRKKRIGTEFYTQMQYDGGRNMPLRYLNGGGFRLNLILNDKVDIHTGLGLMYEFERWLNEGQTIEKSLVKTSNYLVVEYQISPEVRFNVINYFQSGNDRKYDVFRSRLSGDADMIFTIFKRLSITASFSYQYENRPIIPIKRFIYRYQNGIKLNF